ncbi:MAG: hypothetical protein QNK36_05185 [Colwellia sp.]|nr:hypothetical protein [Colwellia sp.]
MNFLRVNNLIELRKGYWCSYTYSHSLVSFKKTLINLLFIFSLFGLAGCQTPLDVAGDKHKTTAEKWYALATYTESDLVKYGVTITAQFDVDFTQTPQTFKLTGFKIENDKNRRKINLLRPSFEHRYVCTPICYQLLEYVSFSGESGDTLLSNFFSEHEFELFQFYGDMVILNDKLTKLADRNKLLLSSYLNSLASKNLSFNTTKEFISYLDKVISFSEFEYFINNPSDIYSDFLQNQKISPSQQRLNAFNKEQEGWTTSTEIPVITWTNSPTLLPEAIWLKEISVQNSHTDGIPTTKNQSSDKNQLSWQSAKATPIKVGQNVCSYQESFFGVVTAIYFDNVMVNILGQAKRINEGIVYPAEKGDLFTMNEEVYFLPLTEKRSFEKSDVASCALE